MISFNAHENPPMQRLKGRAREAIIHQDLAAWYMYL
jgi:hypothetical protein